MHPRDLPTPIARRSSLLPTLQLPQSAGNVKIFEAIEVVKKGVMAKIEDSRARIQLGKLIF